MTNAEPRPTSYLDTLLLYYEEEIMGEAYFYGLSNHFDGPGEKEKLNLLAEVERHAAKAVKPLLEKHGLVSRTEAELQSIGKRDVEQHAGWDWNALITDMSVRYPDYLVEFDSLEKMAPDDDLAPLQFLTEHEVVAIEFANKELAGDADSAEPLRRYLATEPPQV
ncbi:MAG: hypothetical protein ACR2O4_01125 [Hyphomicrobiaceae bacterium]